MAFSADRRTQIATEFGFDSDRNFIMFTISNPTDSDVDGSIVSPAFPNSPVVYARRNSDIYEAIAFWQDSAGEITLSERCTEVTE